MASEIISRAEALAQGLKRYFTGKPCKHGHVAERLVSIRSCLGCKPDPDKERIRKRAQRQRNPETARARDKRYQDANRELVRARSRDWKERNREQARQLTRDWKAANPEAGKKWHQENRDKSRAAVRRYYDKNQPAMVERATIQGRKRRAQMKGSGGTHTAADLADILRMQKHRCAHPGCGADLRKVGKHLDHIMPLALGGSNDRRNLQYLCPTHNLSKGARDPIEYAQMQGRLL